MPEERRREEALARELGREIDNLVAALASGGLVSPAVSRKLAELEARRYEAVARLRELAALGSAPVDLPYPAWVAVRLGDWVVTEAESQAPRSLLRAALHSLGAEAMIVPGKKCGFARLRFRVRGWGVLAAALGDGLPTAVSGMLAAGEEASRPSPEFAVDLGEPSSMDRRAPQIAAWRAEGVKWKKIVRRTGMDLNRVYIAHRHWTGATGADGERP